MLVASLQSPGRSMMARASTAPAPDLAGDRAEAARLMFGGWPLADRSAWNSWVRGIIVAATASVVRVIAVDVAAASPRRAVLQVLTLSRSRRALPASFLGFDRRSSSSYQGISDDRVPFRQPRPTSRQGYELDLKASSPKRCATRPRRRSISISARQDALRHLPRARLAVPDFALAISSHGPDRPGPCHPRCRMSARP